MLFRAEAPYRLVGRYRHFKGTLSPSSALNVKTVCFSETLVVPITTQNIIITFSEDDYETYLIVILHTGTNFSVLS
jgi:hypothetical protein